MLQLWTNLKSYLRGDDLLNQLEVDVHWYITTQDYHDRQIINAYDAIIKMQDAGRKHQADRGHARCWENDEELYKALHILPQNVRADLPPLAEHKKECDKYRATLYSVTLTEAENGCKAPPKLPLVDLDRPDSIDG